MLHACETDCLQECMKYQYIFNYNGHVRAIYFGVLLFHEAIWCLRYVVLHVFAYMYDYNEQSKFYGHVCMYVRACVRVCEPCNHLRSLIVTQYSRLFQKDIWTSVPLPYEYTFSYKGTRLTGFAHPLLSLFTQLTLKSIYLYFLYVLLLHIYSYANLCSLCDTLYSTYYLILKVGP